MKFDDILPIVLSCSEAALIENKMACSRPRKRSKKDVEKALQESIDECNRLLESSKKPRKKTRFRISQVSLKFWSITFTETTAPQNVTDNM